MRSAAGYGRAGRQESGAERESSGVHEEQRRNASAHPAHTIHSSADQSLQGDGIDIAMKLHLALPTPLLLFSFLIIHQNREFSF